MGGFTDKKHRLSAISNLMPTVEGEQARMLQMYLNAVSDIGEDLIPEFLDHPYANHIMAGPIAFDDLMKRLDSAGNDTETAEIVDAICEIIERYTETPEVVAKLRSLSTHPSDLVVACTFRGLALARDEEFLSYQHQILGSDRPEFVRSAVIFIGLGRYERALPTLLSLIRPSNMSMVPSILWALGEIASEATLPTLHAMLEERIMAMDVIVALGKIGSASSIPLLLGVLSFGTVGERECAARAVGLIALQNAGDLGPELEDGAKKVLLRIIDSDPDRRTRYFALTAYAYLGGKLPQNRVFRSLGAELPDTDVPPMAAFFTQRSKNVPS